MVFNLNSKGISHLLVPILVVVAVAIGGTAFLVASHAASNGTKVKVRTLLKGESKNYVCANVGMEFTPYYGGSRMRASGSSCLGTKNGNLTFTVPKGAKDVQVDVPKKVGNCAVTNDGGNSPDGSRAYFNIRDGKSDTKTFTYKKEKGCG